MAGVVPKRSTSGRKQWTLHDGPRNSLKRLRSQLANDGCPESQVVLAKQLLDDSYTEIKSEKKENARIGVYWLMKASEQGHVEATELLKTCLKSGKGISEHNYLDVKSCISMTQDEKLARKAAREMFASLSNGGEYITSDQLQKKILSIDKNHDTIKPSELKESSENGNALNGELANNFEGVTDSDDDTDWSLRCNETNEKLTEDHLVSAAVDYAHGHLPIVNRALCLTQPNPKALDHILYVHRSILHPLIVMKILYFKILRFISQKYMLVVPVARSELQLLVFLGIYACFSSDDAIYFFPTLLYYVTFIIMTITTFQMLQSRHDFLDFRLWSGLFICYSEGSLNADEAEQLYIRNNLKPYGHFFLALMVNFVVYSIISEQRIPESEITVIAFCLTFMTLLGFMPKRRSKTMVDAMVLFSFAINVLAKYPYETDPVVTQGWRFLDLKIPTFTSYVIGNGIEFCINFRMVLYAIIPILFVKMASKQKWRGTYRILIPHCVTLSWLQVCIISSQGATMYGLLRGTLALVGTVLFLPLMGITTVLLPAAALTKWIIASNVIYTLCLFSVISAVGLGICWCLAQTRFKNYSAVIQVFLMVIAFLTLLNTAAQKRHVEEFYADDKLPQLLSWEVFQRYCHQPVWQDENVAVAQINCAELEDSLVHWDGYITDIKIKSIYNPFKWFISHFPKVFVEYLTCSYGDQIIDSRCNDISGKARDNCNSFFNSMRSSSKCTLQKYNIYIFEVIIRMQSGIWGKSPEVTLVAKDYFKNFTMKLKPNDHIWFHGTLSNENSAGSDGILGGFKPHINLEEIGCVVCGNNQLTALKHSTQREIDVHSIINGIIIGCKFLFNVLFYPVVVLK